jgi:hypothetical protein
MCAACAGITQPACCRGCLWFRPCNGQPGARQAGTCQLLRLPGCIPGVAAERPLLTPHGRTWPTPAQASFLLRRSPAFRQALFGGCGFVPDVPSLQAWLESAWRAGFDPQGAEQLGGQVQGGRKWIGTTEAAALFRWVGLPRAFRPPSPAGLQPAPVPGSAPAPPRLPHASTHPAQAFWPQGARRGLLHQGRRGAALGQRAGRHHTRGRRLRRVRAQPHRGHQAQVGRLAGSLLQVSCQEARQPGLQRPAAGAPAPGSSCSSARQPAQHLLAAGASRPGAPPSLPPPQVHQPRQLRLLPGLRRQRCRLGGRALRAARLRGQAAGRGAEAGAGAGGVAAQVGLLMAACRAPPAAVAAARLRGEAACAGGQRGERGSPLAHPPRRLCPPPRREQQLREGSAEPADSCGSDGSAGGGGGSKDGADEAAAGTRHKELLEWVGGCVAVGAAGGLAGLPSVPALTRALPVWAAGAQTAGRWCRL